MLSTVHLSADPAPALEAMEELKALLEASPPWLRWLAVELLEHFDYSVDLVRVDSECDTTPGTSQLRVAAQPTQKVLLLLAALRAGNGQAYGLVDGEFETHGGSREE